MGVKGLWQLLEAELDSSDLFIDPQDLNNKILAVDVSIWLYQFVRAIPSDNTGRINPLIISGLFQRICKLLHFGVKPIFVFDGNAPSLKKEVVKLRKDIRSNSENDHSKIAEKILKNKLKLHALKNLDLANPSIQPPTTKTNYPPIDFMIEDAKELDIDDDDRFSDYESESGSDSNNNINVHDVIDTTSLEFKKLPFDVQEQILLGFRKRTIDPSQLIEVESREESSAESSSPKKSDTAIDFSKAQIDALIKRRKLMNELESLRGNTNTSAEISNSRSLKLGNIASSSEKNYLFLKNTRAGWSLSLQEQGKNNDEEEVVILNNVTNTKKYINQYDNNPDIGIVDIDDDTEFMERMFGSEETECSDDFNIKVEVQSKVSISSQITIQSIEPPSSSNEPVSAVLDVDEMGVSEESRFDIDVPSKRADNSRIHDDDPLFSEELIHLQDEPSYAYVLIKEKEKETETKNNKDERYFGEIEVEERDSHKAVDSFTSNSSSLDGEYLDFIQQVSLNNNNDNNNNNNNDDLSINISNPDRSSAPSNYSLLIEKIQQENLRFSSLGDVAITNSSAPTKKLTDLFMEMLHFFNLPLVVAPFEAEAQCAFLKGINGIISDDSDCLLFGGNAIYRHFFNSGKSGIMQRFDSQKIQTRLGLSKDDFIILAHLLGCDYCPGISGIGPKRALDILKAIKKDEVNPLNISSTLVRILEFAKDKNNPFYKLLSDKVHPNFGDSRVTDAFINPIVNEIDLSTLKWGEINKVELKRFMSTHAKWTHDKTDSYIKHAKIK